MMTEQMQPGLELDTAVAEQVMGYVPCDHWIIDPNTGDIVGIEAHAKHGDQICYPRGHPSKYSTDWGETGRVVDRMVELGYRPKIMKYLGNNGWGAKFHRDEPPFSLWPMTNCPTVQHSISLAALTALEYNPQE